VTHRGDPGAWRDRLHLSRRSVRAAWPERVSAHATLARVIARDPAAGQVTIQVAAVGLVSVLTADDAPPTLPRAVLEALADTVRAGLDEGMEGN
jgi:hypothetical protein